MCGYDACEDRDVPGCDTVRSIYICGVGDDSCGSSYGSYSGYPSSNEPVYPFDGTIGHLRFWHGMALDASQIQLLNHEATLAPSPIPTMLPTGSAGCPWDSNSPIYAALVSSNPFVSPDMSLCSTSGGISVACHVSKEDKSSRTVKASTL